MNDFRLSANYLLLSGMFKGRSGCTRERKERAERWFLGRDSD